MNRRNKFKLIYLPIIFSLLLSGCAALDDEEERAVGQAPGLDSNINRVNRNSDSSNANYQNQTSNAPQEGVIRVRRHGPGYDVTMDINASDDNIAFLMDLPQQKQVDKLKKDIYSSVKLLMDAQSLFYKEDYSKALETIDMSIELAPDNPHAHALRGSILYKLQKNQDAIYAWQKALELEPTLTEVKSILKKLLGTKE